MKNMEEKHEEEKKQMNKKFEEAEQQSQLKIYELEKAIDAANQKKLSITHGEVCCLRNTHDKDTKHKK